MKQLSIADRVYNYIDYCYQNNEYPLEFISGKWFLGEEEIRSVEGMLLSLDRQTRSMEFNKRMYNFKSIDDINDWLKFYQAYYTYSNPDKEWWYPNNLVKRILENKDNLPRVDELPFPLDSKQLIIIGVMLFKPQEEVLFITTGKGGTGKSTFGNIVKQLFNNDVGACSLDDLSNEFNVAEAVNHRLIYSEELSSNDLNTSVLKQLASKQMINVNPKNKRPYTMRSQSALLFNCNRVPKIDVQDTGILRRIIYYFRNEPIKNPDTSLRDKKYTPEELYIIASAAYQKINSVQDWRVYFEDETFELLMSNNNVYKFRQIDTYSYYVNACRDCGLKPFSEPNWQAINEFIKEYESEAKM